MTRDNIVTRINKAAIKFLEPLTPESTYATIIQEAIKLIEGDDGVMLLQINDELQPVYAIPSKLMNFKVRKRGFAYRSYANKEAFVINADDFAKIHPEAVRDGVRSAIFIPLFYRNKSLGTLAIRSYKTHYEFKEEDLEGLKLYGSLASLAIRKTELYDETKSALESRDLFISMAAHEFRTPITTINGFAQLLQLKLDETSPYKRWVNEIYGECSRLARLVNELLAVSRIQSGKFQFSWSECDMVEIVEKAATTFKFTHPDHKLNTHVKISNSATVVGDQDKLQQVVTNILDNAGKFSPVDKDVTIGLSSKGNLYEIFIEDKGVGIPEKDLPKVFDGFYRGSDNQTQGMGLGLYISKKIVEEHRGEIGIKSKHRKGTKITIKLPKANL